MKFTIISLALASLIIASPQAVPQDQAAATETKATTETQEAARENHLEIVTHECSIAYQDSEGLVWSVQKEHREDLHQNKINIFSNKSGRPIRVEKHVRHEGKLVIKPHCRRNSFELVNKLDKRVNVCEGEDHHGGHGHKKCKCEALGPGDSVTHNGESSISINDHHDDKCAGKGLFQLEHHE